MDGLSFGFPSTRPQPGPSKRGALGRDHGPDAGPSARRIASASSAPRRMRTCSRPAGWVEGQGVGRQAGFRERKRKERRGGSQLVAQMVGCGQHPFRETSCRRVLGALRETRPRPPRIRPPKALRTSPAWDGPSAFSQTAQKLPDHLACFGSSKSNPCLFERCGDCLTGPNGLSHAASKLMFAVKECSQECSTGSSKDILRTAMEIGLVHKLSACAWGCLFV